MLKRSLQIISLTTSLALITFFSTAQKPSPAPVWPKAWSQDYKPFRICGNLYYVGTYDLACYLIITPLGHILINTGLPKSVSMIRAHIKALGFKFSDIKILLATHAHFDHVGGMAEIKKITGARMMIHEKDAAVLADGGNSDYVLGGKGGMFQPVQADVLLRVLIANMPTILEETKLSGMDTYPEVAKDYAYTLDAMKKLQFDLWMASHASQFGLHKKHKPGDGYNPEAFSDRQGYDAMINDLQKEYLKRLGSK